MHVKGSPSLPPPPRPVYRRRGPQPLKVLGSILLPLSLSLFLLWHIVVVVAVTEAGVERAATVVDKDTTRYRKYGTDYWLTYEYADPRGAARGRSRVSSDLWDHFHRGSPLKLRAVRILGLPRSEIVGSGVPLMDASFYVLVAITIGWNALILIVFAAVVKPALRRRAIIKYGTATMGRVVGKSVKRLPKGTTIRTVAYEYSGGEIRRAQGTMDVTAEEYARVHEGDAVPVVFTSGAKGGSVIYG